MVVNDESVWNGGSCRNRITITIIPTKLSNRNMTQRKYKM